MSAYAAFGFLAVVAGCLALYAASPHQRLFAAAWAARPSLIAAAVLLVVGLWLLMQAWQVLAAVFLFTTLVMLCFTLLPYAGALMSTRRDPNASTRSRRS